MNKVGKSRACWLLALSLMLPGAGVCLAQIPNERCIECHSQAEVMLLPVVFADGDAASVYINESAFLQSAHGELSCSECHSDYHPEFRADFVPSESPARKLPSHSEYKSQMNRRCQHCHLDGGDVHCKRISTVLHPAGNEKTPMCTDCHSPHAMSRATHGAGISRTCATCHEEIYRRFTASVHGGALSEHPNHDLPACTACHSGHEGGGKSPAARRVRLGRPCMGCHSDAALMQKYDISTNVVSTYLNDFHGVSLSFYGNDLSYANKDPLVCADCHGYHDVQPLTSPAAVAAMKASLQQACLKCHDNATANFAEAWSAHREPSLSSHLLVFLVKTGYSILIPFVILGLMLHIVFDAVVLPIRQRRNAVGRTAAGRPPGHAEERPRGVPRYFVRFSPMQRAEHLIVLVTFIILLLTGLPQRFHDAAWAAALVRFLGGIDVVRLVHRAAGVVLTVTAIAHFVRVGAGIVFRDAPMSMVPTRKDFEDTIGTLKFQLGFTHIRPRADRFTYGEKFEYWGMILGTIVMVVSGFALMYPMVLSHFLPGQFIAAARTAHSYEAMMALLTIIVWHMYGARFNPCIFTGRISSRHLAEHHPLEFERLAGNLDDSPARSGDVPTPASPRGPWPAPVPAGIIDPASDEESEDDSTRAPVSTTGGV